MFVILAGVAEDIGEHDDIFHLPQLGQFLVDERADADVLQTDGIQHARRSFVQTRRRITRHWFPGQSLDHKAAKLIEVHDIFEFDSITESTAGGDHRVFKLDTSKTDTEIRRAAFGCRRSRHQEPPGATADTGLTGSEELGGWRRLSAGGRDEFSARRAGANASVRTRPTA